MGAASFLCSSGPKPDRRGQLVIPQFSTRRFVPQISKPKGKPEALPRDKTTELTQSTHLPVGIRLSKSTPFNFVKTDDHPTCVTNDFHQLRNNLATHNPSPFRGSTYGFLGKQTKGKLSLGKGEWGFHDFCHALYLLFISSDRGPDDS